MTQETLEEAAEKYFDYNIFCDGITDFEKEISIRSYIAGAKWQQERMYSEEDMTNYALYILHNNVITPKEWLKQFKKK